MLLLFLDGCSLLCSNLFAFVEDDRAIPQAMGDAGLWLSTQKANLGLLIVEGC